MEIRYTPREYLEPFLVSRQSTIVRAGRLATSIKRDHCLPVTVYRLADVEAFVRDYIYTGLIKHPRFRLPSKRRQTSSRFKETNHG